MSQRPVSQQTGPLRTVLAHRAAVTRTPDGEIRAYAVSQGTNPPLSLVDGSGRRRADVALPGAGGGWGVAATGDGGCVVGTYFNGGMFAWDGTAEEATVLGRPTEETTYVWDVVTLPDGTTLAATYPDASIVSHHPDRGFTVLRRFATEGVLYGRAVNVDLERRMVWCGIGVTPCSVIGFPLDAPESATHRLRGLADHLVPSQISCLGGRIWLRAGGELWSFDPTELDGDGPLAERVAGTAEDIAGYLSPEAAGLSWVTDHDGRLVRIDLAARTATRTIELGFGPLLGSEVFDGVLVGVFGHQRPVLARIDVSDPTAPRVLDRVPAEVKAVPSHMGHLISVPGSDIDLVLSAGQQGDIVQWFRSNGSFGPNVTIGQVESWAWGEDGILYAGTYPRAQLVAVDPADVTAPRVLADLHDSHHQSRPIATCPTPGAVFLGTTPGYGLRDGALTRADLATGEVTVAMLTDETVHAIATDGTALLVGTSPEAGTGTPEHDGHGRLLRVDPVSLAVLAERPAPGGARTLAAIAHLAGAWWLVADHALWTFDPQTLQADRFADLGQPGPSHRAQLLPYRNELVVRVDGDVWLVDPVSAEAEQLSSGCHQVAVVGDDVWAIVRPEGGTTVSDLRRISLA